MVAKMRVGLALQPAIAALFANSPFTDGKLNGLLSARSEIWRHTDPARTGMLAFAFEPGMGFERYVDYALDVPLYFVKRGDHYQDVAGASFRDLLAGRLKQAPGERATIADWANHLSSIFPEVRLKRYLEMRGPDVGPPERIVALSALMAGLYYDPDALRSAEALIEGWTAEDRQKLRDDAPLLGLAAEIRGRDLRAIALDMLAIAHGGLKRRARLNARARTRPSIFVPSRRSRRAAASRRGIGLSATRARGAARSSRRLTRRRFSLGGYAPFGLTQPQRVSPPGLAGGKKRLSSEGRADSLKAGKTAAGDSRAFERRERVGPAADPPVGTRNARPPRYSR